MSDSADIEKAINGIFDPLKIVYVLHLKFGYNSYYFHFHAIESADHFIKMFTATFVRSLSDNKVTSMYLELLTDDEYQKRIKEKEEEE